MRALITGVTGQDGSYLAEFLVEKGYEVHGLVRRSSLEKFDRIQLCIDRINLVEGDLTDQSSLDSVMHAVKPAEVYNMAAQSFVPVSYSQPVLTADVTGLGVVRVLEAIRRHEPESKVLCRHPARRCMARCMNRLKMRIPGSIHAVPTVCPRCLLTTSR